MSTPPRNADGMFAIAMRYYDALLAGDGRAGAEAFTEDGAIDDGGGGHHRGRTRIATFISQRTPGIRLDVPRHLIAEGNRLVVYGFVVFPPHVTKRGLETADAEVKKRMRWTFHFEGELVVHLQNSYVRYFETHDDGSS